MEQAPHGSENMEIQERVWQHVFHKAKIFSEGIESNNAMNILYTAYYGLGIGGAEVSMVMLARALEKKHNIIVSSSGEYKGFRNYKFSKYIKYVPSFYLQNKYLSNFFSEIIKKENIHVIHSHDSRTAIAAIMAAKKNNVRVVNHYRDY